MKTRQANVTFLITIILLLPSLWSYAQHAEKWELISTRSEIKLFERWVNLEDGSRVKERKGILTVNAAKDHVLNVLRNASRQSEWMENVGSSFEIRRQSPDQCYTYTAFSLPWPLADRDMVCLSSQEEVSDGRTLIRLESRPEAWPEQNGVQRFGKYNASWFLRDRRNGSTEVTFSAMSYKASDYPHFILDPLVRDVFLDNLENLRDLLEKEVGSIAEKGQ